VVATLREPSFESFDCPYPKRTGSLFAALALERNNGDWVQPDVTEVKIDDLLNAGTGVIKQKK